MINSASVLILAAIPNPGPMDITPISLAIRPRAVEVGDAPYDWKLQQAGAMTEVKLAQTQTAVCDTGPRSTNIAGQADQVPDCRFD